MDSPLRDMKKREAKRKVKIGVECSYEGCPEFTIASCMACHSFFCRFHWSPQELEEHIEHMGGINSK